MQTKTGEEQIKDKIKGLTAKDAEDRLARDGYNELPAQKQRSVFYIIIEVLKEPMLLLLVGAGFIYFLLGERSDAIMLSLFIFFIVGITFYQERKTERALDSLRNLSSPRALVLRDGIQRRIAGREVVKGDILVLCEGDRVPADAAVLDSANLMVDESMLTGESLPVSKAEWDGAANLDEQCPGGDGTPFVYSGTMVVRGHAMARVLATGLGTQMGKIGKSLQEIKESEPLLKKETAYLVKLFGFIGLALCAIVVLFYGLFRDGWLEGVLYGLTISMSMLPEEFPVVLLIFLTLGAWRLSKRKVLTRNTAAVEMLGSASVLCVDKTGTITLNLMKLDSISVGEKLFEVGAYEDKIEALPEDCHLLMEYAVLASQQDPFDPIEKEIRRMGTFLLSATDHLHDNWELVKEYPFSGNLLALSHVWDSREKDRYVAASKGAPEAIADLCHFSVEEKTKLFAQMQPMLNRGLRLIAVAAAETGKSALPKYQHDFDFKFMGLLGFADPIRPSVPQALKDCYSAGIRVCMITGDYPGTAQFIAKKIGLKNPENYLTGNDLKILSSAELKERMKNTNIFARVLPEQKTLIVNALKSDGEVIAMTGDGVNDAPALKAANIGIAMGERGTDVARETADLVLLNDDFTSIVQGIRTGRGILDNLKKAIAYIFAVHIPIAGMSFFPVVFNMPIVFFPAHIAFLELIIDPSCSVVFESVKEEANIMSRPPRNLKKRVFGKRSFFISLVQGLVILAAVFAIFYLSLSWGKTAEEARTLTFVAIVFANLMLIITNLSWSMNFFQILKRENQALKLVLGGALLFMGAVVFSPFLRGVFHFGAISFLDYFLMFAAGIASVLWFEIYKLFLKRKPRPV